MADLDLGPLQKAAFDQLVAYGLKPLDDVPVNYQITPEGFVELGEWSAVEHDLSLSDGFDAVLTLHLWTRGGGQKSVHALFRLVRSALHNQTLAAPGYTSVIVFVKSVITMKEADGITYHGVVHVEMTAHQ
jgi:hypothetical protein